MVGSIHQFSSGLGPTKNNASCYPRHVRPTFLHFIIICRHCHCFVPLISPTILASSMAGRRLRAEKSDTPTPLFN